MPVWLRWVLAVAVVLFVAFGGLMWLVVDGLWLSPGEAATEELPPWARWALGGEAAVEELPPSERGLLPTTSLPTIVGRPNTESEASRSEQAFSELDCDFHGTSRLEPPLPMGNLWATSRHTMTLEPGSRFECTSSAGPSAGTITLNATFESLSALSGVTTGSGRIDWSEVAPSERGLGEVLEPSNTLIEVQLDYPVIVVWTTIVDGPYAGFRGRLVLRDWERLTDDAGRVTGIEFEPTSTTFTPI